MGRFRRTPLGYSPEEVDAALSAYDVRIAELEQERDSARAALGIAESHYDGPESIGGLMERIDEIQAQARGQATRIRMLALKEAAEVNRRVRQLAQRAAGEGEAGRSGFARTPAAAVAPVVRDTGPSAGFAAEPVAAARLFDGIVRVDVGPLRDFSQLAAVQDGLDALPAVAKVELAGVTDGRASLVASLTGPVDLAAELQRVSEPGATARPIAPDAVELELSAAAAQHPRRAA